MSQLIPISKKMFSIFKRVTCNLTINLQKCNTLFLVYLNIYNGYNICHIGLWNSVRQDWNLWKSPHSLQVTSVSKTSVPQGSTLGPLLFLVDSNDMEQKISFGYLSQCADDTAIIISDPLFATVSEEITQTAKAI